MRMTAAEWTELIKDTVRHIADKAYQERSWLGRGTEVDSPEEMFCRLFDDLDFEGFLKAEDVPLTADQRMRGRLLSYKMNDYASRTPKLLNATEVLKDPRWEEIRAAADGFLEIILHAGGKGSPG